MTDPLKIMDEIEQLPCNDGNILMIPRKEWHHFRAALEAQAEELAQVTAKWEATSNYAKGCAETISALQSDVFEAQAKANELEIELAQKDARIARLEKLIREAEECVTFEINPSNYDHDDVCELNAQTFECLTTLNVALNEHPRQSAAAIKAEALHQFGDRLVAEQANDPNQDFAKLAHDEADRIEREAKEES